MSMREDEVHDNFTPDGKHLMLGSSADVPMPPNFGPTGDASFCPQPWGRVIDEDGGIASGAEEYAEDQNGTS